MYDFSTADRSTALRLLQAEIKIVGVGSRPFESYSPPLSAVSKKN